jgi:hypothetical protein
MAKNTMVKVAVIACKSIKLIIYYKSIKQCKNHAIGNDSKKNPVDNKITSITYKNSA